MGLASYKLSELHMTGMFLWQWAPTFIEGCIVERKVRPKITIAKKNTCRLKATWINTTSQALDNVNKPEELHNSKYINLFLKVCNLEKCYVNLLLLGQKSFF